MRRRQALASAGAVALCCAAPSALRAAALGPGLDTTLLDETVARASALPRLHALLVARDGTELVAHAFSGPGLDRATNVKSVSKSVISALAGVAIERGILKGVNQPIVSVLGDVPAEADPRVGTITVGHLLSMRAARHPRLPIRSGV